MRTSVDAWHNAISAGFGVQRCTICLRTALETLVAGALQPAFQVRCIFASNAKGARTSLLLLFRLACRAVSHFSQLQSLWLQRCRLPRNLLAAALPAAAHSLESLVLLQVRARRALFGLFRASAVTPLILNLEHHAVSCCACYLH